MTWAERLYPLWFLLCVGLTVAAIVAEEPPKTLVSAILTVETGSFLRPDGTVYYLDRRDGKAGETGPSQIGRMVAKQWHLDRNRLRTDTAYALAATITHLRWLRAHLASWDDVPAAWNAGLTGRRRTSALAYARRVAAAL